MHSLNYALDQENLRLKAKNVKLKQALEMAVETAEMLKTQRNKYSERFSYLSHEVDSLRDVAQDLKSAKEKESAKGGNSNTLNTYIQTAKKTTSIDPMTQRP